MHVAQDGKDDIFTFMENRIGDGGNPLYFVVWNRSSNRVLRRIRNDAAFDANAALPDKSGRWIFFPLNKTQPDGARIKVLDLQNDSWQTIHWNRADDSPSHGDVGRGTVTGRGNFSGGFNLRSLSNVHKSKILFDNKDARSILDWTNDQHTSLYADDESWVLLGLYDDPAETGTETGAFADGRFIAFTSNWGKSGRYDLFIAKIDPAPRLSGLSQTQPSAPLGLVRQRRVTQARPASRPPRTENQLR